MAKARKGNIVYNIISSGKTGSLDITLRYIVFNFALTAGGTFLIVFGVTVFLDGNTFRALFDFFVGGLCFATIILLRTRLPLQIPGGVAIGAFGGLCIILIASGDLNGMASLWIFSYPLIAIFVLGLKMGLIYTTVLLCGIITLTIVPGLANNSYSIFIATRLFGVYFLVGFLTVIYEQSRLFKDNQVNQLHNELRIERDVITAMKDNLHIGMFLMDKSYVIQGAYSKPLEDILGTDEIEGKKFTDFLASSLKSKERETLEDYFQMVLTRQFDQQMLEEINPISELAYTDNTSRDNKVLRTVFSTVDQGLNDYFVLGSVEDITVTKELQRQLEAEATRREEEMRALSQVIQVDPAVFGDFIDDTEFEFETINDILKNEKVSAKDAMVLVYQSVHAIKSNALILGLDNFSGKLHELENTIKKIRDEEEVSFENVLHVTVELERIMKEKDRYRDIIRKIESFKTKAGGKRRQDRYVLVETLSKACEKAAKSEEKDVALFVEELDGSILEYGPRRVIKEVLTQLVRNSVVHGIETPRERQTKNKDSQGNIRVSITRDNGLIHLKLSDDGKGLDFNSIRDKVLGLKLLSKEDAGNKDKLIQAIFSPGFSTANTADLHAGRGIGLNLVKERIRSLNGSIKVSTEQGKGTTFNLFIPFSEKTEEKIDEEFDEKDIDEKIEEKMEIKAS